MPVLVAQALGAILRHLLTMLAGYFVARGIWQPEAADGYVTAAAAGALALGWSLYQKHKGRLRLLAALELPAGASEDDAKLAAKG